MKILLITFDKEMENKIRQLLKDYPIVTAKNGEEALLLNLGNDVDLIIYDALAGGIAEDDINRLYDEGYKNVPYIILMDDLFPIDPSNIKPKNKKILSREVEVEKLPKVVEEVLSGKGAPESVQEQPAEEAKEKTETEEVPQTTTGESSWEELFAGVSTVKPQTEKETKEEPPVEEKKEEFEVAAKEETKPPAAETPKTEETVSAPSVPSLKKKCLVVSFDMPLVEKIQQLLDDKCEIAVARSAKQALQKYGNDMFDIIIFDTISGVFAEKGIKDLYSRDNFKDSLYVLLLDEFFPIDIEKLPVQNLRAIKRESELDLLPEIVEKAPHITLEKQLFESAKVPETTEQAAEEKPLEVKEEPPVAVAEKPSEPAEVAKEETTKIGQIIEEQPTEEEVKTIPAAEEVKEKPAVVEEVKAPPREEKTAIPQTAPQVVQPQPTVTVQISEEQITKIVEQKLNEKVIPLVEELIRSKLSDIYVKALARELIEEQIDPAEIKEIVREIAEPIVRETLESLLTE